MTRNVLLVGAIVSAIGLASFFGVNKVKAEEKLYIGSTVSVTATWLCDEQEAARAILEAQKESVALSYHVGKNFARMPSKYSGGMCALIAPPSSMEVTFVKTVETVNGVLNHKGDRITMYVVAVLYTSGAGNNTPGFVISLHNIQKKSVRESI